MTTPVWIQLREQELATIERAAELCGRSLTDFVEAAMRAAEGVLLEQWTVRLPAFEFEAFKTELKAPAKAVPSLIELLHRRAPWDPD